jgi:hypothetical protein
VSDSLSKRPEFLPHHLRVRRFERLAYLFGRLSQ